MVDARVVGSAGKAFDDAALAAVAAFVFEPAEIDDKPAPVKITYRYDFVLKEEPRGPVVNFEGVVRSRHTKQPIPGAVVTVDGKIKVTTDEQGQFELTDLPPGKHTVEVGRPGRRPREHRGDDRGGQEARRAIHRRAQGGAKGRGRRRRGGGGRRAPDPEGRRLHPDRRRGGAARARHAGGHAQGGAEPARRGARGRRLGAARRVGGGARGHARLRGRRARSRSSITVAGYGRRSTRTSSAPWISSPAATGRSTGAASAASSPSTRARRAPRPSTATSPPTSPTRRRWSRARSATTPRFAVAFRKSYLDRVLTLTSDNVERPLPHPPVLGRPGAHRTRPARERDDRDLRARVERPARPLPRRRRSDAGEEREHGPRFRAGDDQYRYQMPDGSTLSDHALDRARRERPASRTSAGPPRPRHRQRRLRAARRLAGPGPTVARRDRGARHGGDGLGHQPRAAP